MTKRTHITPPEAAKRIGVSPATVIAWCKSGKLIASNTSESTRPRFKISEENWAKFLKEREPAPRKKKKRRRRVVKPEKDFFPEYG